MLYQLVDTFVAAAGPGVMKQLILDRGFIDGARIAKCKTKYGIDVLLPLRANMALYKDVLGLLNDASVIFTQYEPPKHKPAQYPGPASNPDAVRKRERKRQETIRNNKDNGSVDSPESVLVKSEVAGISGFCWDLCPVPLSLIVNRENLAGYADN